MFGGIIGYAQGKPFASLSNIGLTLKAPSALPGAKPLQYEPDSPPSKSYVVVPPAVMADGEALRSWIVRAVNGLGTTPAKKTKPKR